MSAYVPLAPVYDALTRDVPYGRFADFYEALFRRYGLEPQMLLDLACGTGTLTALLARRGYELIGVDGSAEMLMVAREKSATCPIPPLLLCQSMAELDLYGTVDAAICSLDGINYLPPEELGEVFHRLRLFIRPGGLFIFDVNTPEKLKGLDGQVFLDETEEVFCVWRAEWSEAEQSCAYGIDLFLREGKRWQRRQEEHIEYAHTPARLTRALEKEGFGQIALFGELTESPPRPGEQRVFIAAVRE